MQNTKSEITGVRLTKIRWLGKKINKLDVVCNLPNFLILVPLARVELALPKGHGF